MVNIYATQVKDFSSWLLSESGNFASVFSDRDSTDQHYRSLGVIYSAAGITRSVLDAEITAITDALSMTSAVGIDMEDLSERELRIRDAIEVISTTCAAQLLTLGPRSSEVMCAIANEHPAVAYAMSKLGRE
jgi:hypothetical protein